MKQPLLNAFEFELNLAFELYEKSDFERCFSHLERAHVLGQSYVIPHFRVHFWMLKVGLRKSDCKEVVGQILRCIGSFFSRIWVPVGNTGGANVPGWKRMPIPRDLKDILDQS